MGHPVNWYMGFERAVGMEQDKISANHNPLGHSDIKTTLDVYGHLLKDANPAAAARTDMLIFEEEASAHLK